jgi:xanthosine utilization system XapX-like protein
LKTAGKILIVIGIVGLIVGIGIYQFKTKMIEVNKFTVTIDSMTYYTKLSNWDFAKYYHVDEQVTPTATTKPVV